MASISTSISRVFKYGILGFLRNGFVSLATVLVMTIALFMIVATIFSDAALKSVLNTIKNQVDINIYFMPDAPEKDIKAFAQDIKNRPEIKELTLKSREDILKEFKERHSNDELTIQSLDELGTNPFGATLAVRAKDPSQYESIAKYLDTKINALNKNGKIIEKINFTDSKKAIDTLNSIIRSSKQIGIIVLSFLIIVAILIVFNTIRLAVYTNKNEISVMKLVGASDWYVQGPFVIEGALYGFLSALLTLAVLYPLSIYLAVPSEQFLGNFNTYEFFITHLTKIISVLFGVGVLLGVVSSYLSVRKYLDV